MVTLESLSVPPMVEVSTVSNIILDCPFSVTKDEKKGLVLKWYHNSLYIPVYQWMPPNPPGGLGIMKGKIDLNFSISGDPHTQHRALAILAPTIQMSGDYTCKVATVKNEVSLTASMVVYQPPETVLITQDHTSSQVVNITCMVDRCFPKPQVKIIVGSEDYQEGGFDGMELKK